MSELEKKALKEAIKEDLKEDLVIRVRAGNLPLIKAVVASSVLVAGAMFSVSTYWVGKIRDLDDMKKFQTKAEPKLEQHDKQIAVLNSKLDIK